MLVSLCNRNIHSQLYFICKSWHSAFKESKSIFFFFLSLSRIAWRYCRAPPETIEQRQATWVTNELYYICIINERNCMTSLVKEVRLSNKRANCQTAKSSLSLHDSSCFFDNGWSHETRTHLLYSAHAN